MAGGSAVTVDRQLCSGPVYDWLSLSICVSLGSSSSATVGAGVYRLRYGGPTKEQVRVRECEVRVVNTGQESLGFG
jgi:hypothetical protein